MSKFKKLLSVLLVATMIFTTFSMGIYVSAENTAAETNATSDSPLKIEVTTNKSSYGLFDVADITVNITNISDNTVKNISAEAIFDDLAPVDSLYSETSKKVEALESRESFSFSYKATLSLDNSDIGFFSKIILWFVRIFNDGYTVINSSSADDRELISKTDVINFGNLSSNNVINVWYMGEISDTDFNTFQSIRKSIENISEKEKVIDILDKEIKNGNVTDYQVFENYITFETVFGIKGIWEDETFFNSENKSVSLSGKSNKVKKTPSGNSYKDIINQVTSSSVVSSIGDVAVIRPYRSTDFKYDDFLTTGEIIADAIGSEIDVFDNANATLSVLGNLDDYGIILFDSHGTLIANETYICLTQTYNNQEIQSSDLDSIFVNQNNQIYISSNFFEENYNDNTFDECLVFLGTCYSMYDNSFSDTLVSKGVDCVYGYTNPVSVTFCNDTLVESMLENILLAENTSQDAYNETISICGQTDPHNANTDFVMQQSGDFCLSQTGYTVGVVKDSISDKVVSGVTVTVSNEIYTTTGKTDADGVFKIELPVGTYKITLSKDGYTYKQERTINVQENVAKTEGVLYLYNGIINGNVKEEVTGNAISGVTVEFVDNSSDSFDPVASATTDENGLFSVKLPYGSYSMSFNHDNYEYYGTTVNVDTENVVLTEPILLAPKNSSGGGVEVAKFLGKDISEVIKEYGNNYVEESIEGGHFFVYNNLGFGITENAYAGLESKTVVAIQAITTNSYLYDGLYANMSYNELKTVISNVAKPQYYYDEMYGEAVYCTSFVYGQYLFYYEWSEYSSDDDICYKAVVVLDPNQTEKTIIDSGSCGADGDNVIWTLYDDGELVISGSGAMADYQDWKDIPWHNVRGQIKSVIIKNGIKRIGSYSFGNCSNLQNITIGESVECIGEMSLSATSLKNIIIPDSVKSIEKSAFFGCSYLESVILGKNVAIIGQMAFQRCEKLVSITIPKSLSLIGSQAFYKCNNLKNVNYSGTSTNWANISMGSYNTCLTSATIHYNS